MKKVSFKERFSYWFDNRMSAGSFGLIRLLAIATLFVALVIALLLFLFGLKEDGFLATLWNSFVNIINSSLPEYEGEGIGYTVLASVGAIVGLFVTSVLIGIIASAIEEKITSLKRGNSRIIEEDHFVVLGFYPGEYTLIRQLILAADDEPCCIVVAGDVEQEDMEQYIEDNVDIPKNVRLICRTVDIFDPKALERCSLSRCRTVVISPTDDFRTTKALLAVSTILTGEAAGKVRVSAIVSRPEYRFPPSIAAKHNVTTLQTQETIAKIIAHSCTEPGLSETFREVFNFEGSELYLLPMPKAAGITFGELMLRVDSGVPVGLYRNGITRLNVPTETVIEEDDRILVFTETQDSAKFLDMPEMAELPERKGSASEEPAGTVAIIGGNDTLEIVLRDLPENLSEVIIAGVPEGQRQEILDIAAERGDLNVSFYPRNISRISALSDLAKQAEHMVILSDYTKPDDTADMDTIFRLLNLRDIRTRYSLSYNITAEMRREHNQSLVVTDDNTDFVVASNMSSLLLAQLAESPELITAFQELLSNEGSELFLKTAKQMNCTGEWTVAELRAITLQYGYITMGYRLTGTSENHFNPPLDEKVTLESDDSLIVIGKD
ncbi:MAG: hypothetical protein IJL78_08935 [Lachnospiraceae bacterium]|nr:hypothetical protein [Lachnospiraceae bacterium]